MNLRKPTPVDAPELARILVDAFGGIARQHNFPLDFPDPAMAGRLLEFFIHHPNGVGFLAEEDGRILGSNFLDRRDAIAAVGPITVDPNAQAKGVGRRLMQATIDAGKDNPGIRLVQDAFNTASMSLYTSLGFDAMEPLALMRGKPKTPPTLAGGVEARAMREDDLPACADLCRRVHGGIDRTNELRDAIKMFHPFVLTRAGRVVAYASAPTFWFLNHGVAESLADMQTLLAAAGAANEEPLMLLLPSRQADLFRWCLAQGLRMVKPMTLMSMREYHEPKGAWYPSVGY
jgi:GNAT superfamily N-acetyltransferase